MSAARGYVLLFWLIWLAIAAAASWGPLGSDSSAVAVGFGSVTLPIICYLWCKADCSARAVRAPPGAIPLMAGLLLFGWAYYLFGTRPPLKAAAVVVETLAGAIAVLAIAKVIFGAGAHVAT